MRRKKASSTKSYVTDSKSLLVSGSFHLCFFFYYRLVHMYYVLRQHADWLVLQCRAPQTKTCDFALNVRSKRLLAGCELNV